GIARRKAKVGGVMIRRMWLLVVAFLVLAVPARADNRIIVRTTLLQPLQQLCLLQCTVSPLGDPLNQLFLVTTSLNPNLLLDLISALPGFVDAEIDNLISLIGGSNSGTPATAPAALTDSTPVPYHNSTVWHGYTNQPAAQIVRVSDAQTQFSV